VFDEDCDEECNALNEERDALDGNATRSTRNARARRGMRGVREPRRDMLAERD
jgi:hypothetical protein